MNTAIVMDSTFEKDFVTIRDASIGGTKWQKEAEAACAVLDGLGIVEKKRAAAEWTSNIVGKPYLHALHKAEIRQWAYEDVRSTIEIGRAHV